MHTPPWQASPLVQALPSSQGVVSSTAMPVHTPLWQVSPVVQAFPSSHGVLSGSGVPAQTPPSQVSSDEQALPSWQLVPVSGVTVQLAVPLQVRVLHWSEVQVIAVPTHCPPLVQVSLNEQSLPSSQLVPVSGVTVQLAVPLQVRVLHWSEVQVMAVPTHCPPLVQASLNEQALPASHAAAVLWQTPASQVSTVQAFPSLQLAAVEQGVQPAMRVLWQTPETQESVVQAFWSPQSAAVVQGVQPSIGVLSQTPPSQES